MSMYSNNSKKFVAVLNKKVPLPTLFNAVGHISVGISSLGSQNGEMNFLEYADGSGGVHPAISEFPFIVLSAKNGNQIRTLRNAAIEQGLVYNDFVDTMIGASASDQLRQTREKPEGELEYWAILLFGEAEKLDPLTKKFSLFR